MQFPTLPSAASVFATQPEAVECLATKKHLPILQNLIKIALYNFVTVTALANSKMVDSTKRLEIYNSFFAGKIELEHSVVVAVFRQLIEVLSTQNSPGIEAIASFVRDDILEIIALAPWADSFARVN